MTKTTKILLGVGALALAYYLFKDKFNKPKATISSSSNDANFSNLTAPITLGGTPDCNIFHENPRIVREQMRLCESVGQVYGGRCVGCVTPKKIK